MVIQFYSNGNTVGRALKGNRQNGDILIALWEILLDLSRKFYSACCHLLHIVEECFLAYGKSKSSKLKGNNKSYLRWILIIILWTILISGSVTFMADVLLRNVEILVAFILLIIIIGIGIFFDIIGVAVTAANETPFHSMASKKLIGAKVAIGLIRNADKVSNFCNDVIGDVCGIISGSAGTIITAKIVFSHSNVVELLMTALIGALIAAFTVAGKAIGKSYAINNSNNIILWVSKVLYFFKKDR